MTRVDGRWAVVLGDSAFPVSTHSTRDDAIGVARAIAIREELELAALVQQGDEDRHAGRSGPVHPLRLSGPTPAISGATRAGVPSSLRPTRVDREPDVSAHALGENMQVLLVEDDPSVAMTGALVLRRLGHDVEIAQSGNEAIEWLSSGANFPELLIVDLELPGVHGSEVLRVARALHPNAILMATSGYPLPQELVCDVILPKPYGATSIEKCLARVAEARNGQVPPQSRPVIASGPDPV